MLIRLVVIFFLLTHFVFSQTETKGKELPGQWKGLKYDKIIAYKTKPVHHFVRGQVLTDSVIIKKAQLSASQSSELKSFLFNTSTYGTIPVILNGGLCCNDYHLVFYEDKKIIAFITFQFDSNTLMTNFKIPARSEKLIKAPGNNNYYVEGEGFSEEGKEKVIKLLRATGIMAVN